MSLIQSPCSFCLETNYGMYTVVNFIVLLNFFVYKFRDISELWYLSACKNIYCSILSGSLISDDKTIFAVAPEIEMSRVIHCI